MLLALLIAATLTACVRDMSRAETTWCTFCCNPGCDGANATPSPTPTPTPSPSPSPTPAPEQFATVDMACATYGLPNRSSATSGNFETADIIKNNCRLVLTWWGVEVAHSWCPYIMDDPNKTEFCGPYDNWGYMHSEDNANAFNLGGDLYNYGDVFSSCNGSCGMVLREQGAAVAVTNAWGATEYEKLTDKGNASFVDFFMDFYEDVPNSPARLARWEGTYETKHWNVRFLDNFLVWLAPDGGWSDTPHNPRTGSVYTRSDMDDDVLSATQQLRARAEALDTVLFANIWSDVEAQYFDRAIYPALMDEVDFALFETWVCNPEGTAESEATWLRRVNAAKDMVQNRLANPVVDGRFCDLWYSLSTLLLVREQDRGLIWFQSSLPNSTNMTKMNTLDCGAPLEDYHAVGSTHYEREWENCLILVNPKTSSTGNINLGQTYTNLDTGESISSINISAKDGAILIKQ